MKSFAGFQASRTSARLSQRKEGTDSVAPSALVARLQLVEMSDTLYLSLWYPNLRLESLASKLTVVLSEFAAHGGEARVYAATVWPMNWSEPPVLQRVWGRGQHASEGGVEPRLAVEEALEQLYDDYAYEFQIGWNLWVLDSQNAATLPSTQSGLSTPPLVNPDNNHQGRWVREPRLVRVTAYGPLFDEGAYEADGHIRIDFGPDAPFLDEWEDDKELNPIAARHVDENIRQLVALASAVEKASGATARLLWSELGESLAQRLATRLGVAN